MTIPTHVTVVVADDVSPLLVAQTNTPNLDRLARWTESGGVVSIEPQLARAYTFGRGAPACSAHEALLLTGRMAHRPENLVGGVLKRNTTPPWSLPTDTGGILLPQSAPGVSRHAGKWHVADEANFGHAIDCGHEKFDGHMMNLNPGDYGGQYGTWWANAWAIGTAQGWTTNTAYVTQHIGARAAEYINAGVPLVTVKFPNVHKPHTRPPDGTFVGDYDLGTEWGLKQAKLEAMDYYLAQIIEATFAQGGVFIFTCDNAGTAGEDGKGTLYDSTLRVPLLIACPGLVHADLSDALAQPEDLYATIIELRGGASFTPDGFSLVDEMQGGTFGRDYGRMVRFQGAGEIPRTPTGDPKVERAAWMRDWKLIAHWDSQPAEYELFDLTNDPNEQTNLWPTMAGSSEFVELEAALPLVA